MLDSKETKLLMKFSIYPKLMLGGFVAMLASAVFSCILLIPNSLLLNISPKQLPDYILTLDSVVMFGGAFIGIFSLIAIKVIQGYPEFKSLQKGAFNEFDSTDYIKAIRDETKLLDSEEAAAVTFGVIFAMAFAAMEAADKMAQEYKVKVPKLENTIITMIFISLFIILSANTIACFNLCKERRLHFAEAKIELDSIYDTLMQSDVDRVKAEEPSAKLIDFPVRAYWNEDEIDEYQLNVELNAEDLKIDSISYYLEFDGSKDIENNYDDLVDKVGKAQKILEQITVPWKYEGMADAMQIPDEFKEVFMDSSDGDIRYDYENVRANIDFENTTNYKGEKIIKVNIFLFGQLGKGE